MFQLEVGRLSGLFLISAMCFFTRSLCATVGVFHVFLLNRLFVYNGAWRWLRLFQNRVFKLSLEPTQHVRSGPELLNTMNITEDHPQEVWLDYVGLLRSNIYIYIYIFLTSFPISILYVYIYVCVCLSDPQDMFFDWKTPASKSTKPRLRHGSQDLSCHSDGASGCSGRWGPMWRSEDVRPSLTRFSRETCQFANWKITIFNW